MGITNADDETVSEILRQVKEKGIEKRGLVDDAEFKQIVEAVTASPAKASA
jgi:isopropylmalate/homocitrate/citramalate synthase